jgi:hypothetical protein
MYTRIRCFSNSKAIKSSKKDTSEDEEIKKIIKEINHDNKNRLFLDYKSPTKIRTFIRSQSTFATSTTNMHHKISFINDKPENSLSFKLKDKITKETLILELRQELKYHIKFEAVYKNLLKKITHLKEMVKENKDNIQKNTDTLKETFLDRFNIIDNYEKTILMLNEEKIDIHKSNKEIINMRQINKEKLNKEFNDIQIRNSQQREKIDSLQKKINELEYQKAHLNEELNEKMAQDKINYEKHLKLYKTLCQKYEIFLDEYNSYLKTGDEITKIEVKLFDDTNIKNSLIEEDLEVKLSDKLLKKTFLLGNIKDLKLQIKLVEEKLQEEKLKEEKRANNLKIFDNNRSRMARNIDIPKAWSKTFKKSSSYNDIISKKN